jgi:peptidoglycan/LPS O-acetylase OafA/YrhL
VLTLVFLTAGAPATFADRWQYLYSYTYNYALLLVPLEQSPAYTHFWSLAIEEQFYLLWPLAVYYFPAAWLRTVTGVVLLVSPIVRLVAVASAPWLAPGHPEPGLWAYCPLPAQFDALATGAGLSLIDHARLPRPALTLGVITAIAAGLGWMNASAIYHDSLAATGAPPSFLGVLWHSGTSLGYPPFGIQRYQHVWSYTAINLWSAGLIVNLLRGGRLSAVFARGWLVYTGQISYGLYVFHYPILALVKSAIYFRPVSPRGIAVFVFYIPLLFAIATASFLFFESRFLALKERRYSHRRPSSAVQV